MRQLALFVALMLVPLVLVPAGCRGEKGDDVPLGVDPTRKLVCWVKGGRLDEVVAERLARSGFTELAFPSGRIRIVGPSPVLELSSKVVPPSALKAAAVFRLEAAAEPPAEAAKVLWGVVSGALGWEPAELLLEIGSSSPGLAAFFEELSAACPKPVVPVLAASQLGDPEAVNVAKAAGQCVVVAYGNLARWRRGAKPLDTPLRDGLAPLADGHTVVRVGVVIEPETEPQVDGWPEDPDPLFEVGKARLDSAARGWKLYVRKPVKWSGLQLQSGSVVWLDFLDPSRLDRMVEDSHRLGLPYCGGWDVLWLPGRSTRGLGFDIESLCGYFSGSGPEPLVRVRRTNRGRRFRVELWNRNEFPSAPSSFENWVQVEVDRGYLVVEHPGDFDMVVAGRLEGDLVRRAATTKTKVARLYEYYVAPGERVVSGTVTVYGGGRVRLSWQLILGDGRKVGGHL